MHTDNLSNKVFNNFQLNRPNSQEIKDFESHNKLFQFGKMTINTNNLTFYAKNRISNNNQNDFKSDYIEKNIMIKSIYNKTNKLLKGGSSSNNGFFSVDKNNKQKKNDLTNQEVQQINLPYLVKKQLIKTSKNSTLFNKFDKEPDYSSFTSNQLNNLNRVKEIKEDISIPDPSSKSINYNKEIDHTISTKEKVYDITNVYKKNFYSSKKSNIIVQEFAYLEDQNIPFKDNMEDVSKTIENFTNNPNYLLFSLYDGHGGSEIAKYCKDNFPLNFSKLIINLKNILDNYSQIEREKRLISNIELFLKTSYLKTDENSKVVNNHQAGSTALTAFFVYDNNKKYLFVANLGDSTAYLVNKNYTKKLSFDHLCTDYSESKRVTSTGGYIFANRVMGELMVTRAFGDHKLKLFGVSSEPSIHMRIINEDDQWLILASDGIWDVISERDLKDICGNIKSAEEYSKILCKIAIFRGSKDNISCIVVKL